MKGKNNEKRKDIGMTKFRITVMGMGMGLYMYPEFLRYGSCIIWDTVP